MNTTITDSRNSLDKIRRRGWQLSRVVFTIAFGLAQGLVSPASLAASGDLDTTFGGGIILRIVGPSYDLGVSSALQPDGRLLVGGSTSADGGGYLDDFALIRHNADSSSDSTFGAGTGQVITPVLPFWDRINSLVVQPDGKIVGAGYATQSNLSMFGLARYNINGTLDTTFGGGTGKVVTPFSTFGSWGYGVALQPDGKIVVAGGATDLTTKMDFLIARYNSDGTLDVSFGVGGSVRVVMSTIDQDSAWSVVLQTDGKIIAVGEARVGNNYDMAMVRLTSTGVLDTTFGSGGKVITSLSGISGYFDSVRAVAVQPDGKIVLGGASATDNFDNRGIAVLRYNTNGSLDTTFNGTGYILHKIGAGKVEINSLAVLPTGQILVAGTSQVGTASRFLAARYTETGAIDTSFGAGQGYVVTTVLNGATGGRSLALAPDGKFTISGYSNGVFAIARYLGDTQDVAPDPVSFTNVTGVPPSSLQISDLITISGLTPNASVPVTISGGTYSINGDPFVSTLGWAKNGDQIMVSHTSSASSGSSTTTTLRVGGLHAPNNPSLILGVPVTAIFASTTL